MNDLNDLEFETPLEEEGGAMELSSAQRKINTRVADPQIDALHGKFKRGKLVVQPDFQRQYVWNTEKASKLIESALLAIPIPTIYLSEEPDDREYVIDGQVSKHIGR
jgi:uncharacterized protein with ParB-like and HNH nuclease domain